MAPQQERGRADLQARLNALTVWRDGLARRYPGSFGSPETAPLGPRAPPEALREWGNVTQALQEIEAQLEALDQ
jgi:hypothetical protein